MYFSGIEDELYLNDIAGVDIHSMKFFLLYADDIAIFRNHLQGYSEG